MLFGRLCEARNERGHAGHTRVLPLELHLLPPLLEDSREGVLLLLGKVVRHAETLADRRGVFVLDHECSLGAREKQEAGDIHVLGGQHEVEEDVLLHLHEVGIELQRAAFLKAVRLQGRLNLREGRILVVGHVLAQLRHQALLERQANRILDALLQHCGPEIRGDARCLCGQAEYSTIATLQGDRPTLQLIGATDRTGGEGEVPQDVVQVASHLTGGS
mmetsp:Transcript_87420/g.187522  ORF Transcript_87420/g.187522 Transcript_87420/m.187522 type:complete len:218 (-) Transcript_87420:70-723(-)